MAIETLDDLNQILGQCCCPMPECPVPTKQCESVHLYICGYSFPACEDITAADQCRRFATRTDSEVYAGTIDDVLQNDERWDCTFNREYITPRSVEMIDGSCVYSIEEATTFIRFEKDVEHQVYNEETEEYEFQYFYNHVSEENSVSIGGVGCSGVFQTWEISDDPAHNGTSGPIEFGGNCLFADHDVALTECDWTRTGETFTKSEAWVPSLFGVDGTGTLEKSSVFSDEILIHDELALLTFEDDANGEECAADFACDSITKARFRWVIPDTRPDQNTGLPVTFPGSYFKVTWDILEEPDGWDDETPTVFRSFHLTDQTWEWTGPGDPEDADTWKSGWYVIDPPEVPGTRRVVNIRFECYRSPRFGNKPQVTGEAVELPDP